MVRAYYYNDTPEDQRYPHEYDPSRPVSLETLERIGVKYRAIPVEGHEQAIDDVAKELDYKNRDDINVTKEGLGDLYESKIKGFFEEHLHEDEEIRYIAGGSGFFDVRESPSDQWIRIAVEAGDLLVLPAGIYHRFTLDTNDKLSAKRLFKDEPKWTPINRSQKTDENPYRVEYLRSIGLSA
ncbi:1,2-dihydroxy-3-keto-5-methylthiopentene dioxygenase [Tulasnella sp. 418]|nr:1,2-dihydroxy-3-keto-5-methylthiopentene dioxygenase [Tulasnella sp. 418]